MPFCPRCRCEYNVGVEQCVDCHVPLVLRRPERRPLFDFDFDELPEQTAPVSGAAAAAALLVSSLMIARARRRAEPRDVVWDTIQETREQSRRTLRPPRRKETLLGGLGLGGSALVVGAVWLIWRLLKGHDNGPRHLYITDRMGE